MERGTLIKTDDREYRFTVSREDFRKYGHRIVELNSGVTTVKYLIPNYPQIRYQEVESIIELSMTHKLNDILYIMYMKKYHEELDRH